MHFLLYIIIKSEYMCSNMIRLYITIRWKLYVHNFLQDFYSIFCHHMQLALSLFCATLRHRVDTQQIAFNNSFYHLWLHLWMTIFNLKCSITHYLKHPDLASCVCKGRSFLQLFDLDNSLNCSVPPSNHTTA
jgi:hypothetical protein